MNKKSFLFEVSWEVCNKVGGIYTVLRTKAKQAMKNFGENYILIGPWLQENAHFVELTSPFLEKVAKALASKDLHCRIGYWDIGYGEVNEQPLVILVGSKDRYNIDTLLYDLWSDYGVDSLASNFDYYEPILFSTAAGEVIQTIWEDVLEKEGDVIAHFHEWMCGAGALHLKKYARPITTVFTTHATVLGRALSGANRQVYDLPKTFNPSIEAKKFGVYAKHSMELATAREVDCFTTVSNITADEAVIMLGKYPDKIVFNGLDIERIQQLKDEKRIAPTRAKLLQVARKVTGKELKENTLLMQTSGRFEFHNKGFDTLLTTLPHLEQSLAPEDPDIVMFFFIAASHHTKDDSLLDRDLAASGMPEQQVAAGIATHRLWNPSDDPIVRMCHDLNINQPDHKVHVVYTDAYLDGSDGVFDISYEQIMDACDLSLFLSFYEPWGYTPPESLAHATPTVTTDLAGFGSWVLNLKEDYRDAVYVLERKGKDIDLVVKNLTDRLMVMIKRDPAQTPAIRKKALKIAKLVDWQNFYKEYLDAYAQAIEFNDIYYARFDATKEANKYYTLIHEPETTEPRFRHLQKECHLPEELAGLRDIAYNFWWSWHDSVKVLFQAIDPVLWDKSRHNPVYFLNTVSQAALTKKLTDESYMHEYHNKLDFFNTYYQEKETCTVCPGTNLITKERPIAYFCMEYGLDESLPIYSGGLGILAGDYLKTMSDLNIPMIAVGLFYKQGYFHQSINFQNEQIALYDTQDVNQVPMQLVNDESGKAVLISVEILDRTVQVRVWEVKVGRISLYLLDTDIPENSPQDRAITGRLYAGLRDTRLVQEIILGIGGERFIAEKLNVNPILYHLNEGHSAFLLLERIKNFYKAGYSFADACAAVQGSGIFTTHTSVPAGNEVFSIDMIKKYFAKYQEIMGVPIEQIIELARDPAQKAPVFSMTALALKLTNGANAVSQIHGVVSRSMFKDIWRGFLEPEVPIESITNGIHISTWIGNPMKLLYDHYLGSDWKVMQTDAKLWDKITLISDKAIWDTHQMQKEVLLDAIRDRIVREYPLRNANKELISASLESLDGDVLLIGLARRFATYKRNTLILRDQERLARILTNEQRPVVLVIAGKAHPLDGAGKDMVQQVIEIARASSFKGHIIFLEEYDMALGKLLVQGVDIWLNTPLLGREACGTSGMKAGLNGGLNFSVKDGWWDEVYNEKVGWAIESFPDLTDTEKRNDMENMYLLDTLEYVIAPLYYARRNTNFSPEWVSKMKSSIASIACQYSSQRMADDYLAKLYGPVAEHFVALEKDDFAQLKEIVAWKRNIAERFNTVKIKTILINGVKDGKIRTKGVIKIKVLLFSGKLTASELKVELILAKTEEEKFINQPQIIPLKLADERESGILTYTVECNIEDAGFYSYGVRVLPLNPELLRWQSVGAVCWG